MRKYLGYLPTILCLIYYILVCLMTARLGGAQLVWLAMAAFFAVYTWLWRQVKERCSPAANGRQSDVSAALGGRVARRRKLALRVGTILLIAGVAIGGVIEGVILSAMVKEPAVEADYVIVLGAKVNGTTPSWSLRKRIDSAAEYLLDNPNTVAVASGGQGSDEGIAEGKAITIALEAKGIEPDRILVEDKSTSTEENLTFSRALIESHGGSVESETVVVTSDFHMFRSLRLAERLGYENVSGKPAGTLWILIPQNHVREILAIGYYFVSGTL